MSSVLKIEYDPHSNYCTLHHSYNKRFISYLSGGIKPSSYRRYDPATRKWMVHASRLPLVIMFGRKYFDHVDYRSLPEDLQIRVVKAVKQGWGSTMDKKPPVLSSPTGPHAVLFVLETAPWEVVNAAYKALALKLHPDKGGSAEDFQQLQKAYEQLKAKYNT